MASTRGASLGCATSERRIEMFSSEKSTDSRTASITASRSVAQLTVQCIMNCCNFNYVLYLVAINKQAGSLGSPLTAVPGGVDHIARNPAQNNPSGWGSRNIYFSANTHVFFQFSYSLLCVFFVSFKLKIVPISAL